MWSDPPRVPDPPDPLEALLLASIILCAGLIIRYASLQIYGTSKTRLGCGTKSMLTFPAADIVKLYEIISNDALILRQKAD